MAYFEIEKMQKYKNILILGGYGFLGTNIMHYIDNNSSDLPYKFIVFDKFNSHPCGVKLHCVEKSYAGDFADIDLLDRIFCENNIDLVIHTLSTTIPVSSSNARYDVESNLIPTLDLLGMMVKHDVRDIVYLSSGGAIYGTYNNPPYSESDDVFPLSSYGVVKLTIEKYMMQYAQLYGIRPLILRLSNPYGSFHYSMKQGVINIAIAKALRHEPFHIWGDGNGKKDYIYVADFVDILFQLISKNVSNQILNVGSNILLSVNDITSAVQKLVRKIEVVYVGAQKFDASHFELNTTKLISIIGDYKFTSFADGLTKTFQWTKSICD